MDFGNELARYRFAINRPQDHAIISGVTDPMSPEELEEAWRYLEATKAKWEAENGAGAAVEDLPVPSEN